MFAGTKNPDARDCTRMVDRVKKTGYNILDMRVKYATKYDSKAGKTWQNVPLMKMKALIR